jgi:hypothetical protein
MSALAAVMDTPRGCNDYGMSFNLDTGVSDDAYELRSLKKHYLQHLKETQTYSRMTIPDSIREELYELVSEYGHDDWDGYGAKKVDWETISVAYDFLMALPKDLSYPEIDADTQGEVSFEWYRSPRRLLTVKVNKQGEITFAGLFGPLDKSYGSKFFNNKVPDELVGLIRKV